MGRAWPLQRNFQGAAERTWPVLETCWPIGRSEGTAIATDLDGSILEDIDYHAYIDDGTDEGRDRWDNIMELRRLAAEYQEQGMNSFLEQVALVSDQDTPGGLRQRADFADTACREGAGISGSVYSWAE